jgi:hypothetical protein
MKRVIIVLLLLLICQPVEAKNYSPNYTSERYVANKYSSLNGMERKIFNQTFNDDTVKNRIERLETKIFGAIQIGTLDDRFLTLKNAIKCYKTFSTDSEVPKSVYDEYHTPMFTGTSGSSWKSMLLGNFRNQFTGTPTGFTPAMDPAYMDYFEAERALMRSGQNRYNRNNYGYRYSDILRGSRTGVQILD